jgi:phage shock protein PspC (stress-responsive transcriptional regulator)
MTTTPDEPLHHEPSSTPGATDDPGTKTHDTGSTTGSTTGSGTGPTTPPAAGFFDSIRKLGITRPDDGRIAAGVAAGIARRYGFDPAVSRIGFIVLTLLGGLGVALYGLGWLLLPHPDGRIHAQQLLAGVVTTGAVGAVIATLAGLHHILPILAIALVAYLVIRLIRGSRPQHA